MYDILHDVYIESPRIKVYEAISSPEHLTNWWPQKCHGENREGCVYNFYFTEEYDWYGVVAKTENGGKFHIKMTKSDQDWDSTSFGFDLEDQGKGTNLKFWHKGWPELNHHFRRSSYCWAILLKGLKDYVEKGIVLPFEQRN